MVQPDRFSEHTLTIKDVMEILRVGQVAAYRLIHSKPFPVVCVGGSYRIPKDTFMEWLNHKEEKPMEVDLVTTNDSACILSKIKNGGLYYGNKKV